MPAQKEDKRRNYEKEYLALMQGLAVLKTRKAEGILKEILYRRRTNAKAGSRTIVLVSLR